MFWCDGMVGIWISYGEGFSFVRAKRRRLVSSDILSWKWCRNVLEYSFWVSEEVWLWISGLLRC